MNWDAVGAIAEAIGAIAIVVSLVYVSIQIRHNTEQTTRSIKAEEQAAFERNIASGNRVRELLILNPDILELLYRAYDSYDNLNGLEKVRFGMMLRNIFSEMQGAYIRQLGTLHDPRRLEGTKRVIDDILRNRGVRQWLETFEPDWRPEFKEYIDQRLSAFESEEAEPMS
jgi:hypothetical protein